MISTSLLHPMLVHFPIALIIIGFLADLSYIFFKKEVCLSKCGFYLLISGTLAAMAAALTGLLFTSETSGDVKETHELFAFITLGILIVCSVIRVVLKTKDRENTDFKWIVFILYGMAAVSVSITGYYGGTLVYG